MPSSGVEASMETKEVLGPLSANWQSAKGEEERVKAEAASMAHEGVRQAHEAVNDAREEFLSGVATAVNTGSATLDEAKDFLSQWFEIRESRWQALEQTREVAQPGARILFADEDQDHFSRYYLGSVIKPADIWFSGSYMDSLDLGLSVKVNYKKKPLAFEVYSAEPEWGNTIIGEEHIKSALIKHLQESGSRAVTELAPIASSLVEAGIEFEDDPMEVLSKKAKSALHLYSWRGENLNLRNHIEVDYGAGRVMRFFKTVQEYLPDAYEELVDKLAVMVASRRDFVRSMDNGVILGSIFALDSEGQRLKPVEFYEKVLEIAKRGQTILEDGDRLESLVDRQG